ncbi:MAG: LytTR family DNA-binding domain-containing protein [Bacteroidota bacterium]
MPINCIIIDDEPLAIQVLETHLKEIPDVAILATFQNPVKALDHLKTEKVDLIFLDIQMPLLTGIDFLKSTSDLPGVIFTTAFRNYAIESYELDVIDYLLKPISFTRLFKAVNKFKSQRNLPVSTPSQDQFTAAVNDHIYVNANKKFVKVLFNDILYIESMKDYIKIHTVSNQVVTKDKLSAFEEKLPDHFIRLHRSFLVNMREITAFTAMDVEIGKKEIPIGNSYKQYVLEKLKEKS